MLKDIIKFNKLIRKTFKKLKFINFKKKVNKKKLLIKYLKYNNKINLFLRDIII
jgi:hypothetical protein